MGIDAHPGEHTALAINRFEEEKGSFRFDNTMTGITDFLSWLSTIDTPAERIIVGIEGGTSTRHGLLAKLLERYEHVYEVNPLYTKQRRTFGTRGVKSDPVDAKLIAEVLTRKLTALPKITKQELSAHRLCLRKTVWLYEETTRAGTRHQNQLHQLKRELTVSTSPEEKQVLTTIITEKKKEVARIQKQLNKITAQLEELLEDQGANLLSFPGIGVVSAAKIVAHTNGVERFRTVDAFLSYAGIAPTERSSGKSKRHRQSTNGNRRLNSTLYMVALNQLTRSGKGKAYFAKKVAEGKSKKHALRCLMKRVGCIVYGMLKSGDDYRA